MGYEIGITRTLAEMIFRGVYSAVIPGGPRPPKKGEELPPSGVIGGSVNHDKLALVARLAWLQDRAQDAMRELREATLAHLTARLKSELTEAWMTRGSACEQNPPSHFQWHITAAFATLYLGLRYDLPDLAALALAWIRACLAMLDVFGPAVPWEGVATGKVSPVDGLLLVGARAFTDDKTGELVGGRSIVADKLWAWSRRGTKLRLGDPLQEIDELALHFVLLTEKRLPNLWDLLSWSNADAALVPPLKYPAEVWKAPGGTAFRLAEAHDLAGAQHLAGILRGTKFFGFAPGSPLQDFGAPAGWRLTETIRGAPIREYPPIAASGPPAPVSPLPAPPPAPEPPIPPAGAGGVQWAIARLRDIAERRAGARAEILEVVADLERLP